MHVFAADVLVHHTLTDVVSRGAVSALVRVTHAWVLRSEITLDAAAEVVRVGADVVASVVGWVQIKQRARGLRELQILQEMPLQIHCIKSKIA